MLLVVIGPRWAELLKSRQGDPNDFVAIEITAALDQGKRVIPVLVGGAGMPHADTLPEVIRRLARRNAVGLRPERFKADCQGLISALRESLAAAEHERAARTEAERKAAEAARLEAEAHAAARAKAAEERGRAEAAAGLSAEQIRKAEELASWDFVKDRNEVQELRDHLARFPGGTTERWARTKLDGHVWAGLGSTPAIEHLRAYLDEFPKGTNAGVAQVQIAALEREAAEARAAEQRRAQETAEWGAVAVSTDRGAIEAFLKQWPNGQHTSAARARIAELRRGAGGLQRGILLGAGATGVLAIAIAGLVWINQAYIKEQMYRVANVDPYVLKPEAERALRPLASFRECAKDCPEMIVIPAGSFVMGSPAAEKGRHTDEDPQHRVAIAVPLAVSKFAVTFADWDACVLVGGCPQARDSGFGRGTRPVIYVSWDEAQQYVAWFSKMTGESYRLLSEAEWEYAARAGSTTAYFWGDEIGKKKANCNGCGSQWDNRETSPAGSFKPNAFGLYDMAGNVWQWVQDCYQQNYNEALGDCRRRVVRGGSWSDLPQNLRSDIRLRLPTEHRSNHVGFRLGRTLTP